MAFSGCVFGQQRRLNGSKVGSPEEGAGECSPGCGFVSPSWPSFGKHFARIENRFAQRLPSHKASAKQADFVIEGYVDPCEPLCEEGPFGDHTGYYTLPEPYPVFHVTAVTHRKDAVYPATIVSPSSGADG
jgi:hypothetical protein